MERPKLLEEEKEAAMHVIAHGAGNAYAARRALGLEPGRHIYPVAMQVGAIGKHVANVDADTKSDGAIGRLIAIVVRHPFLHVDSAAHSPVDAVEHDEQRIASGLNDPAAMLVDRWVDQNTAEGPQPLERSYIIQPNQAAVTDHIGIEHGDQLASAWCPSDKVRCVDHRHPEEPCTHVVAGTRKDR
jgi:hypothetical protein